MSRCAMCDYSSDLDPHHHKDVNWYERAKEFRCTECHASVIQTTHGSKAARLKNIPRPTYGGWRTNQNPLPLLLTNERVLESAEILVESGLEVYQDEDSYDETS